MTVVVLIMLAAAAVLSVVTAVNLTRASWHLEQARLWRTDPDAARRRAASRPWYLGKDR